MGTFDFMAPEQWHDTHNVDIRADLYSLGCTLYYLLAGQAPFSGPSYADPLRKRKGHAEDPLPDLGRFRSDVPAELRAILERLLAKSPADRYATPAELTTALDRFLTKPATLPRRQFGKQTIQRNSLRLFNLVTGGRRRMLVPLVLLLFLPLGLLLLYMQPPRKLQYAKDMAESMHASAVPFTVPSPVRIELMQIEHFRGDPATKLGSIGELSPGAAFDDAIRVKARFSQPCYCYLIAFNPDGKAQPCYPENFYAAPKQVQELVYPAEPSKYFPLNDNPKGGLQVFVLAASLRPLESYGAWTRRVGTPPWKHVREQETWRFDGDKFRLLTVARGHPEVRGRVPLVVSLLGSQKSASLAGIPWGAVYLNRPDGAPWVLANLGWFFQKEKQPGDALEVIAFPVQPKQ
jgi:hypothetical protein